MTKILFVNENDDDKDLFFQGFQERCGHQIETVFNNHIALDRLTSKEFDVVITDIVPTAVNQYCILDYVVGNCPDTSCIILAKDVSVKHSVAAIKRGAFDYLARSSEPEELLSIVEKALKKHEQGVQTKIEGNLENTINFDGLIGKSRAMMEVFKIIEKVAKTTSTALITGESGTGKELIARAIHRNSDRADAPMIVINCGAIPSELLESELFGHEKGAFTGAHRTRIGRFEMADGGTIFLDEVGDMSPDLQVKLLRAIQEQVFERVGGMKSIQVDIRIIAATHQNLMTSIKENRFREDLYYRLNVIPIHVPPLIERKSDITILADYFMKRLSARTGQGQKSFTDKAMRSLIEYNWPGNIRELENLMERLHVLVDGDTIDMGDLPDYISGHIPYEKTLAFDPFESGIGFNDAVEQHQKALILKALEKSNWVKAKAADLLKMNRTTLVEKIKKMNLEPEKFKKSEDEII
ncbi:MAG: sigma-54 dependent transcriptional regulator [Proteobacteria bacterium]|nr:sigma-54 dependent transcriptional regulator [Pseudomonadota bacterium]